MSFNHKDYADELLFIPLGGLNEIGMNLALFALDGKFLMVDCGIGFAEDFLPGIEVVVPDISYIVKHKKDLLGLVLTHAHEDHFGAVPYLWEELQCPIYATPFTAALLKAKLSEEGLAGKVPVHEMQPGTAKEIAPFTVEMIPITHSIPEMQGLAIRTRKGVVLHTGDWKFDADPMVGPATDENVLRKYGDEGILAMTCDSTNVFVEGESGSEGVVRKHLVEVIKSCPNRVAVTTFASNIARIETIVRAAEESGRHIVLSGRSLWRVTEAAKQSGYLQDTRPFLSDKEAMNLPKEECLIVCTGCQGEPLASLSKMARGEHPAIRLSPGDTVIFASRKIPGNEARIGHMQNQFAVRDIEVITDNQHFIHVSGHPARDELARMYQHIRPKIAVPVHGEPRHLREHAKLARSLQVPEVIEGKNGSVMLLKEGDARVIGTVDSGYLAIDGTSLIPTTSGVIKTRRRLRDEGVIIASIALERDGDLASPPKLSAPGCLDPKDDQELIAALIEEMGEAVERAEGKGKAIDKVTEAVRLVLRRTIRQELGKKPIIEVLVHRV
jgi:ribonuclease J